MECTITHTYAVTFTSMNGKVLIHYDTRGILVGASIEADMTFAQIQFMWTSIPILETNLSILEFKSKGKMKVERAPDELTFERFWTMYNYKLGKKERAQKLWNALSNADKIICLNSIPKYNKWLSTRTTARLYPETYLSQERFNNEF